MTFLDHQYGYVKDGKVFLKAYREFEDREIGDVREDEEKSLQYFLNKFILAQNKVEDLVKAVSTAQNKGSYLMKLVHLKDYLAQYKAIGDFESLFVSLEKVEDDLNGVIADNREKNLAQKEEIVAKANSIKGSVDWKDATEKFKELQRRWVKIGRAEDLEEDRVTSEFKKAVDYFFGRRNDFYETKKLVFQDRIKIYEDIIAKAAKLIEHPDIELASARFNDLHAQWKKVGNIQRDKLIELWKSFKDYSDQFYEKYNQKKKKKAPKNDFQANYKAKEDLLKEAERLLTIDLESAIEKAKLLQKDFKNIGPSPQAKDISDKFWLTCDFIFETSYLTKVLEKKYADYNDKEESEKIRLKKSVLKELIKRDQDELDLFEENAAKFTSSGKNKINNVIDSRYRNQKRKLTAKEMILERVEMQVSQ